MLFACATVLTAQVEIDGIGYTIYSDYDEFAEVRSAQEDIKHADIKDYITYKGKEYKVETIGENAFRDCTSLISVSIPYSVLSIKASAFRDCTSLTSVSIPYSVLSIGNSAFQDCSALHTVIFEDGDGDLACRVSGQESASNAYNSSFYGCSQLKKLYVGRVIKPIAYSTNYGYPFSGLPIEEISFGPQVNVLTEKIFSGLEKLQSVEIPATMQLLFANVFENSMIKNLTFQQTSNPLFMLGPIGENSGVEVLNLNRPLSTGEVLINDVPHISEPTFKNCRSLTTINFGKEIESIPESMFSGCTSLRSITIPNGIKEIQDKSFAGCTQLKSINIEDGKEPLTIISSTGSSGAGTTFEDAPIETIYLGRNIVYKNTELSPFKNNPLLLNLTIGNDVTNINHYLFYGCTDISMLAVPSSVKSVGDYAFYDCNKSKSLMLSASVQSIGNYAFYNCNSLSNITIPNSVETIGDYAFRNCNSAKKISIGKNVKSIGDFAFLDCYNAESISFGASIETIGNNAFYNCSAVKEIKIPDSATSIGNNAFTMCSQAEKITIGNNVKTIGNNAFSDCTAIEDVTLGRSLAKIGDYAFFNCENIKSIHILAQTPPEADEMVFSDYSATLYVPEGAKGKYNSSAPNCWPLFSTITEEKSNDENSIDEIAQHQDLSVYNLQGNKMSNSLEGLPRGVYIVRQGNKITKVAI